MTGVIAALIYRKGTEEGKAGRSLWILIALSLVMLAGGFALRSFWGISKIRATPAWVMICTSISLASFALIAYITDIRGRQAWCKPLRPAGTSTLTCYLLPYIHFAIGHLLGAAYRLPAVLRTGGIGILKSLLYAFLIVWITGRLEKKKIRLAI
jgi:predicted acyltransferase